MEPQFIISKGDYRNLIVYRKAECIYDITYYFAHSYLSRGDRTVDQMVQAARSGKQNIIEGSAASKTSRETEIKLFNVAKASFDELLADYEDYLRVRGMNMWNEDKVRKVRDFCKANNDSAFYRDIIRQRDDETIANLCITMIRQELYLLVRLIERAKEDFLKHGGIREEMTRARLSYRNGRFGSYGNNGNNGNQPNLPNNPNNPNLPKDPNDPNDPPKQKKCPPISLSGLQIDSSGG